MNAKRAANRARSKDNTQMRGETGSPGWHSGMRGRAVRGRDEHQMERGGNHTHEAHFSHGSPASLGSSKGAGPLPGAGELAGPGVGKAASQYGQADPSMTPTTKMTSTAVPKGMKVYNQE